MTKEDDYYYIGSLLGDLKQRPKDKIKEALRKGQRQGMIQLFARTMYAFHHEIGPAISLDDDELYLLYRILKEGYDQVNGEMTRRITPGFRKTSR